MWRQRAAALAATGIVCANLGCNVYCGGPPRGGLQDACRGADPTERACPGADPTERADSSLTVACYRNLSAYSASQPDSGGTTQRIRVGGRVRVLTPFRAICVPVPHERAPVFELVSEDEESSDPSTTPLSPQIFPPNSVRPSVEEYRARLALAAADAAHGGEVHGRPTHQTPRDVREYNTLELEIAEALRARNVSLKAMSFVATMVRAPFQGNETAESVTDVIESLKNFAGDFWCAVGIFYPRGGCDVE